MSLLQLLTVGQSFRPIKDRPSRYRMRQQYLLRRFGLSICPGPPPGGTSPGSSAPAQAPSKPGLKGQSSAVVQTRMNATNLSSTVSSATPPIVPPQPYPAGRWTSKFKNQFHRSSAPAPPQVPVQGELSLETVRPVRNDLSDSDLEVVPAVGPVQPAPSGAATVPKFSGQASRPASPLLGWLRRQLLRRLD